MLGESISRFRANIRQFSTDMGRMDRDFSIIKLIHPETDTHSLEACKGRAETIISVLNETIAQLEHNLSDAGDISRATDNLEALQAHSHEARATLEEIKSIIEGLGFDPGVLIRTSIETIRSTTILLQTACTLLDTPARDQIRDIQASASEAGEAGEAAAVETFTADDVLSATKYNSGSNKVRFARAAQKIVEEHSGIRPLESFEISELRQLLRKNKKGINSSAATRASVGFKASHTRRVRASLRRAAAPQKVDFSHFTLQPFGSIIFQAPRHEVELAKWPSTANNNCYNFGTGFKSILREAVPGLGGKLPYYTDTTAADPYTPEVLRRAIIADGACPIRDDGRCALDASGAPMDLPEKFSVGHCFLMAAVISTAEDSATSGITDYHFYRKLDDGWYSLQVGKKEIIPHNPGANVVSTEPREFFRSKSYPTWVQYFLVPFDMSVADGDARPALPPGSY
jgi:hypothetical protein